MALIKCPECGKENVSDSADACSNCGYGIREYFESKKQRLNYQRKLDSVQMPQKPEKIKLSIGGWLYILIWLIVGVIFFLVGVSSGMGGLAFVYLIGGGGMSLFFYYIIVLQDYNKKMEKYNRAMRNFDKYKKDEIHEQERKAAMEASKPRCPCCNSANIEKISVVNRAASIAMVGVASSKIGKQYKCKNCKHMW